MTAKYFTATIANLVATIQASGDLTERTCASCATQ
jgi:hypothetical protein